MFLLFIKGASSFTSMALFSLLFSSLFFCLCLLLLFFLFCRTSGIVCSKFSPYLSHPCKTSFHIHVRRKSKEIIFFYKLSMLRDFGWKTNFYGNYPHEAAMLSEAMNPCEHWVKITCGLDLMIAMSFYFLSNPVFISKVHFSVSFDP